MIYHNALSKHFSFYRNLNENGKAKCINRLRAFIDDKVFVGHGIEVTLEMKVLIGFSAIQMTFGLRGYLIPHLRRITVFPRDYEARMLNARVKGLTSEGGTMSLSWKHVLEGHEDESDSLNLAIHEMAHALKINTIKGEPIAGRFSFYLNEWMRIAEPIRKSFDADGPLREYGRSNLHEFFSVTLETFFENPEALKKAHPELYFHTGFLLGQDPENSHSRELTNKFLRRASESNVTLPNEVDKDFSHQGWHWSLNLPLLAFILGPTVIGFLNERTETESQFFIHLTLFSLMLIVLLFKVLVKQKVIPMWAFPLYALIVIPLVSWSAILLLNMSVSLKDASGVYDIQSLQSYSDKRTVVVLKGGHYDNWTYARTSTGRHLSSIPSGFTRVYMVSSYVGLLGLEFVTSTKIHTYKHETEPAVINE